MAPWGVVTPSTDPTPFPAPAVPALPAQGASAPARPVAVRLSAAAVGAAAAALGLGVLTAIVLVLWIASPGSESGFGGALHIGAGLWLLAQGAELVRTDTLSGSPAPIALTPLLLSALPAWLIFRGTASAVSPADEPGPDRTKSWTEAAVVAGWLLAGYLSVVLLAVAFSTGGPIHVDAVTTLYVPLFAMGAAGCGAWSGCGWPALAGWARIPYGMRGYVEEAGIALRAAGIAAGILVGGGALLGGASLVWHADSAGPSYTQTGGPYTGRIVVLLLALALVPNLAVWSASYALGFGFTVGAGSTVGPAGAYGYGLLPRFPLLAALPAEGAGGWVERAALALPLVAAGTAGCWIGRRGGGAGRTARVVAGTAVLLGILLATLAAWSGGSLGRARLAAFGPAWYLTALAALGWTVAVGFPVAFLRRWGGALRTKPPAATGPASLPPPPPLPGPAPAPDPLLPDLLAGPPTPLAPPE
nr:DUF6350 family protein [Streptomyces sp. SID4948]